MKRTPPAILLFLFCLAFGQIIAQEREDRTLLSWDQMRAVINEASGERAMHLTLELVPYPRVRALSEYQNTFRETDVMVKFAKEYGFSNVEVESFPSQGQLWQPTQGELWMVEPEVRKLYDIYDVAISLAGNSESGEVTAEVVDVGTGARKEDYEGKDVSGKIVLGSTGPNALQRLGVFERGAVGVASYTSLRADDYPDQILSSGISSNAPEGKKPGFGWVIAPRIARQISAILNSGRKVVLKSIVKAQTFPGELETVHATIPGDGSTDQVVGVSAHLYEGYIKQGANDDNSGCALTLEMGRAYIRLINEGKLPKPKRTIHFLWVPEISGTNAWLNKHKDIEAKMIADLNFDMEGIRLSTSASFWVLHRTPDTFPTFLNDLGQSMME
ncbi:MAG TPA: M28 family peptidase, partial [Bacteroidota bacterium]|nr:M28 family peptidase [Bacteroidota bacterium]